MTRSVRAPAQPRNGLYGAVVRGPIAPVCREGVPCTEPVAGMRLTFIRASTARRTTTDRSGRYRIALPSGLYAIRTNATPFGRVPTPATARVPRGRFVRLNLEIDTGIR